jgi:spore cortex formation protein SpoVR/YcgB (stage V sporulation)
MKKTSFKEVDLSEHDEEDSPEEEENLLYFIMKYSPNLPQWKREILRIVYKVNQYFYPQGQTKNLNEGFASFTHYYIMTRLEQKGFLSPDAFLAFLESHSAVIYQPEYNKRWYNGPNPYALGFAILMDLKRICEDPTDEDREWFPHLMGRRWQEVVKEAAFEHRDDSFIAQYMSPKVIRDLKLFMISFENHPDGDSENEDDDTILAIVSDIHDDVGYKNVRNALARSMERINYVPQIVVTSADLEGDRTLRLQYVPYMGRSLDLEDADLVTDYIDSLWGYAVEIDC